MNQTRSLTRSINRALSKGEGFDSVLKELREDRDERGIRDILVFYRLANGRLLTISNMADSENQDIIRSLEGSSFWKEGSDA